MLPVVDPLFPASRLEGAFWQHGGTPWELHSWSRFQRRARPAHNGRWTQDDVDLSACCPRPRSGTTAEQFVGGTDTGEHLLLKFVAIGCRSGVAPPPVISLELLASPSGIEHFPGAALISRQEARLCTVCPVLQGFNGRRGPQGERHQKESRGADVYLLLERRVYSAAGGTSVVSGPSGRLAARSSPSAQVGAAAHARRTGHGGIVKGCPDPAGLALRGTAAASTRNTHETKTRPGFPT